VDAENIRLKKACIEESSSRDFKGPSCGCEVVQKLLGTLTCLVLSDHVYLETLAPIINSLCHPATNSVGV